MKKILILSNSASGLYEFRIELIQHLLGGNELYISLPEEDSDRYMRAFADKGCHVIHTPFERRGMNPLKDYELLKTYKRLMAEIGPDAVLTYTIKPNIYGGMAAKSLNIPYITNITGLGTAILSGGTLGNILLKLYAYATSKACCIFFQNSSNMEFMKSHGVRGTGNIRLLPGSGVNLEAHPYADYPPEDNGIEILSVMRIMKDKGIEELLEAADRLGSDPAFAPSGADTSGGDRVRRIHFSIAGSYEEETRSLYEPKIQALEQKGILNFVGFVDDMNPLYAKSHVIVHPSYHEGLSNVCLEAASCGRPVITTDIPGCRETVDTEQPSGLLCQPRSTESLIQSLKKMLALTHSEREAMGRAGRTHVGREFDRNLVIKAYKEELDKI